MLVKHPETHDLYVNFDPQILTLIRETEWMIKLGLDIPPVAKGLKVKQYTLKNNFSALQVNRLYVFIIILLILYIVV